MNIFEKQKLTAATTATASLAPVPVPKNLTCQQPVPKNLTCQQQTWLDQGHLPEGTAALMRTPLQNMATTQAAQMPVEISAANPLHYRQDPKTHGGPVV